MNLPNEWQLTVRAATEADVATIVDFNCRLAIETEHRRLDPRVVERGVRRGLARHDLCRYFVAQRGAAIVGQAMVTFEWTDWRDGVLWWLQSVYIVAEARRQGVFSALYRHIEATARIDADGRGLRLYVERENEPAQAVYARLGMVPSGHFVLESDWSGAIHPPAGSND